MKSILLNILFTLSCVAQIVPPTNNVCCSNYIEIYSLMHYYPGWYYVPMESNKFSFPSPYPLVYPQTSFPAFIVKTNSSHYKISGLIRATYTVNASEDAIFRFGGQGINGQGQWNTGPMPPHVRLFFTTKEGYRSADPCPECSWWSSNGWMALSNSGTFTVEALLDPSSWTDSYAHQSTNDFNNALTNVLQIGLSFGGGSFYDIGVALTTGQAEFELKSVRVYPLTDLVLESSCDLINWTEFSRYTFILTNDATFFKLKIQQ